MARGIIYTMSTAVPGLIKIGKTASENFKQRMYNLESNGYRNVTSLKREFAIEVDNYDEKETLLQTIFEKSRVADTELFALDLNIVIQLLSSFDGYIIYPNGEEKENIFVDATDRSSSKKIPDGVYYLKHKKKTDNNRIINVKATIINGIWTILKGSCLGISEDRTLPAPVKDIRASLPLIDGVLSENASIGECSPSFAGCVVMNQRCNGWTSWKTQDGKAIDIFRTIQDKDESLDN